mgnify:CR=1 FL=1
MGTSGSSRRGFLKYGGAAAVAGGLLTGANLRATEAGGQASDAIKVAGYDYDRVKGIINGRASIPGRDVRFHYANIYDVNRRAFGKEQPYEVTELGLVPYMTRYINHDFRDYTLVPVFISRIFRHRNIFVHSDSGIEAPEQLRGKIVGTPGYGMSANTWIRGFLKDEHGVEADDFTWVETAKSSDGKELNAGFAKYYFPPDFPLKKGPPGIDESELLLSGQCDALITAINPKAFEDRDPGIQRLYPDVKETEQDYYRKTGLFPIMHVVAIRNDAVRKDPSLPMAVYNMYNEAKRQAYTELDSTTALRVTLPWMTQEYEETRDLMGEDYWPYGISQNAKELEVLSRYVHEQGLVKKQVDVRTMFHPSTLET